MVWTFTGSPWRWRELWCVTGCTYAACEPPTGASDTAEPSTDCGHYRQLSRRQNLRAHFPLRTSYIGDCSVEKALSFVCESILESIVIFSILKPKLESI